VRLAELSSSALEAVFRDGSCPRAVDLLGPGGCSSEWRVDMLTGPVPSMGGRLLRHRKRIRCLPDGSVAGCNVFRSNWLWGWFSAVDDLASSGPDRSLLLDYGHPVNLLSNRIRDRVRGTSDPNVLIGQFCVAWRGRPRLVGYFSLTRILTPAGLDV
jgi:hypothetical protein